MTRLTKSCFSLTILVFLTKSMMSTGQSSVAESSSNAASTPPTERTALLPEEERSVAGTNGAEEQDANTPAHKEYSTKEIIVIMSSVWLGAFLSALGM